MVMEAPVHNIEGGGSLSASGKLQFSTVVVVRYDRAPGIF